VEIGSKPHTLPALYEHNVNKNSGVEEIQQGLIMRRDPAGINYEEKKVRDDGTRTRQKECYQSLPARIITD